MLAAENKLNKKNYPLWSYMMRHVLVEQELCNVVIGVEVPPPSREKFAGNVEDDLGASSSMTALIVVLATQEQRRWDGRDA